MKENKRGIDAPRAASSLRDKTSLACSIDAHLAVRTSDPVDLQLHIFFPQGVARLFIAFLSLNSVQI